MQLFSDEEMMPRKTMTQQEFEEYILPYSADIVDAIESAYSESKSYVILSKTLPESKL